MFIFEFWNQSVACYVIGDDILIYWLRVDFLFTQAFEVLKYILTAVFWEIHVFRLLQNENSM